MSESQSKNKNETSLLLAGVVHSVGPRARGGGGYSGGVCQQVSAFCGQQQ